MPENTLVTAEGWAKEVYGDARDLRPDKTTLQPLIKFDQKQKLGDKFVEVIWLSDEAGVTYDAGVNGTAYTLNDAVPAESAKAEASGSEMTLVSQVSLKRLATAVQAGKQAFGNFYSKMLLNMTNTMAKRVDLTMFFGGDSIGTVASETGSAGARALTLSAGSWIPAVWLGAKGARFDIYDATGVTKRNATTDIVVSSVLPNTKVVNVTGLEAELATIVATDIIFYKGAKGNETIGLSTIAGLTSGESYLGIDVDDYPDLWSGNSVAVGGPLQFTDIQEGLMDAAARGGEGDHYLFMSHATWASIADDVNALRSLDDSYSSKETKYGTAKVSFHTATGMVTFVPTLFMREGEAIAIPKGSFKRRGSTDITFDVPGIGESQFRILDGQNGVEVRCYSDQLLWGTDIKSCVHFTGITN